MVELITGCDSVHILGRFCRQAVGLDDYIALWRLKQKVWSMRLWLKHILVAHKYEAEDLLRRLQGGEDFAELAKKYSTCASAASGGDLGVVALHRLDADFAEAAKSLTPGKVSAVVKTRFGHHLILCMPAR